MAQPGESTDGLTVLGATVRHPLEHVETFPAPTGCTLVRFTTAEVMSLCPVTGQPDVSSVTIEYEPNLRCVESKSLKLYLTSFPDRPVRAAVDAPRRAGLAHHDLAQAGQRRLQLIPDPPGEHLAGRVLEARDLVQV